MHGNWLPIISSNIERKIQVFRVMFGNIAFKYFFPFDFESLMEIRQFEIKIDQIDVAEIE